MSTNRPMSASSTRQAKSGAEVQPCCRYAPDLLLTPPINSSLLPVARYCWAHAPCNATRKYFRPRKPLAGLAQHAHSGARCGRRGGGQRALLNRWLNTRRRRCKSWRRTNLSLDALMTLHQTAHCGLIRMQSIPAQASPAQTSPVQASDSIIANTLSSSIATQTD